MDKEEKTGQLKMNMLPCMVSMNALFSVLSLLIDHCEAGSERDILRFVERSVFLFKLGFQREKLLCVYLS